MEELFATNIFTGGYIEFMKAGVVDAFNLFELIHFFGMHDGYTNTLVACTTGSAGAMGINFYIIGQFVIDYVGNANYINSTRSYIGSNQ